MKLTAKIKRTDKFLEKINKSLKKELNNNIDNATDYVLGAIMDKDLLDSKKVFAYGTNSLCRINSTTGEVTDVLMSFSDPQIIEKIKYYLDAYLTTNQDVLPEQTCVEIRDLIDYLS